jgi:hypothetical protein
VDRATSTRRARRAGLVLAAIAGCSDPQDRAPDAPLCSNDSLEVPPRNDTLPNAYRIPVARDLSVTFPRLTICPIGDRDTFALEIAQGEHSLEAITKAEADQPVMVDILDGTGAPIASGSPTSDGSIRALLPTVSAGTSYVQTSAPAGVIASYRITITVTPP